MTHLYILIIPIIIILLIPFSLLFLRAIASQLLSNVQVKEPSVANTSNHGYFYYTDIPADS